MRSIRNRKFCAAHNDIAQMRETELIGNFDGSHTEATTTIQFKFVFFVFVAVIERSMFSLFCAFEQPLRCNRTDFISSLFFFFLKISLASLRTASNPIWLHGITAHDKREIQIMRITRKIVFIILNSYIYIIIKIII